MSKIYNRKPWKRNGREGVKKKEQMWTRPFIKSLSGRDLSGNRYSNDDEYERDSYSVDGVNPEPEEEYLRKYHHRIDMNWHFTEEELVGIGALCREKRTDKLGDIDFYKVDEWISEIIEESLSMFRRGGS